MTLKAKLIVLLLLLFTSFVVISWFSADMLSQQINEQWAQRFVRKQIDFDKYRTLAPIRQEIALVEKLAQEPAIINMALHEDDPVARAEGIKTLERYRTQFADRSYFAAFTQTGNYYFNDRHNRFLGKEWQYTLSSTEVKDRWFYEIIRLGDRYQINVNKDNTLNTTKVWVDYLVRVDGKVVAIIGTGFDFDDFLKESVGIEQDGISNLFINKELAIQLAKDTSIIDYASITKADGSHKTIEMIFKNGDDVKQIKQAIEALSDSIQPQEMRTLWVSINGEKRLLGITYQREVGWFSLTLFSAEQLSIVSRTGIAVLLNLLLALMLMIAGLLVHRFLLKPIAQLKHLMQQLANGHYQGDLPVIGTGEVADLSSQFKMLVAMVREHTQELENTVKQRTAEIQQNEQKLNLILDNVDAYIYLKDTDYHYLYVNKAVQTLFNQSLFDIVGKDDAAFFDEQTARKLRGNDEQVILAGKKIVEEEVNTASDGSITKAFLSVKLPLRREDGSIYALCGISTDITARKQIEDEVRALAFYDSLTSLPNRRLFAERLMQVMTLGQRKGHYGALFVLDLDNFKPLNDEHGHSSGDLLLIDVARRLESCVRESDTVARFGGDEFIVVLSELSCEKSTALEAALVIAEKVRGALEQPYRLTMPSDDGDRCVLHHSAASIGVVLFLGHELSPEALFKLADNAMYVAKSLGRNRIHYSDSDIIS